VNGAFEFRQCATILKATGVRAADLQELRDGIGTVSEESIFHHTFQYFLKGHTMEYTNEFAHWAGESLEERALAERLSNIDPYAFGSIELLRQDIVAAIHDYLDRFPEPRKAMTGQEFYFNETLTLIFPAGVKAGNLAEFLMGIKFVDPESIYYHFYEARIRHGADDFSSWMIEQLGKEDLASKIRAIDPFMHSIEDIRTHISEAVEADVKKDMETAGVES